jgi:hypothetical protein
LDLIVREWFDMRPEMEFRVFVKNRQITAISQYEMLPLSLVSSRFSF